MLDLQQEICVAFRFSARRLRHDYRVAAALLVVGPVPDVKPPVRPALLAAEPKVMQSGLQGHSPTRREADARTLRHAIKISRRSQNFAPISLGYSHG